MTRARKVTNAMQNHMFVILWIVVSFLIWTAVALAKNAGVV